MSDLLHAQAARLPAAAITDRALDRMPAILADLRALVECESPSSDPASLERCARVLSEVISRRLASAPDRTSDALGAPVVTWRGGRGGTALLVGHFDTVWPLGTLERVPFAVREGTVRGPGCFDMKAGLVIAVHALALLAELRGRAALDGMTLLANSDEELGSPGSRGLVESHATHSGAVLVFEGGGSAAEVTTARKGLANYRVVVTGRAAHAGVDPQRGVNAVAAASRFLLAALELAAPDRGTTVTPTLMSGGSSRNTVPARAEIAIDVRAEEQGEQDRVHDALLALAAAPAVDDARIEVAGAPHRPVMAPEASAALFALVREEADALGLPAVGSRATGGGSDANLTAALGVPSIDGLGAIGDGAHADDEHVLVDGLAHRVALVTAVLDRLAASGPDALHTSDRPNTQGEKP
jgi:glutamate carboxypeptidase